MIFVLDTSVTMAWCFRDAITDYTEAILNRLQSEQAAVPEIWPLEVINVLLVAEREARITPTQSEAFVELLANLPIAVVSNKWPEKTTQLLIRGRSTHLSAYDLTYLDLAVRLGYPLATQDRKLQIAAQQLGVPLL